MDRFVGAKRLPDFEDRENLVYIQAILMESMRWIPVTPLSLPHRVIRDDEYKGYLIPKGTVINAVNVFMTSQHTHYRLSTEIECLVSRVDA